MKPPTQRKHRGKLGPRGRTVTATRHFESLARELHASDIYVGLQTGADGMLVWIVDRYARLREDMVIDFDRETGAWVLDKTASEWVHAMALKLFPDSPVTADSVREDGTSGQTYRDSCRCSRQVVCLKCSTCALKCGVLVAIGPCQISSPHAGFSLQP